MIAQIMAVFMILLGGVLWYVMNEIYTRALTSLETAYPSYYAGAGPDFLTAVMTWSPLLVILITALIYVITQSQKPQGAYV